MKILVTGGCGYKGHVLVPKLLARGYQVIAFDLQWFGNYFMTHKNLSVIKGDVRQIDAIPLDGVDCIIHLSSIANDPCGDLDPQLTWEVSALATMQLADKAKRMGIKHFIYASSSSVYGIKQEDKVTEQLSLEPLTDYSKFKMLCEEIILEKHSSDFVCTVLRPATVCGVSPRQRFDLSVNILTNHAVNLGKITVFGGSQSRPNLDIRDMSRAYLHVLKHKDKVAGEVFNVGGENLTLDKIAEKVKHQLGEHAEIQHKATDDLRSYRVDSSKILSKIGFKPSYSVDDSISDLKTAFSNGEFIDSLENPMYFNIKRMKELSLA